MYAVSFRVYRSSEQTPTACELANTQLLDSCCRNRAFILYWLLANKREEMVYWACQADCWYFFFATYVSYFITD